MCSEASVNNDQSTLPVTAVTIITNKLIRTKKPVISKSDRILLHNKQQ